MPETGLKYFLEENLLSVPLTCAEPVLHGLIFRTYPSLKVYRRTVAVMTNSRSQFKNS